MDSNPKIAAIVPVYNVAPYLEQCIASVLDQGSAIKEIILIDDGSTDASGALCDELAQHDAKIRVVHKENAGLGYARNTGLDHVSPESDAVIFVDSDDWLEPGYVDALVRACQEAQADCVIAGFTRRDGESNELFRAQFEPAVFEGDALQTQLVPRVCGSAPGASDSVPMSAWATLYKTSIIDEYHLRFPSEREVLSEDFFFKFQYLLHAQSACLSSCVGYSYRTNNQSLTTSYRPDRFDAALHFYELAKEQVQAALAADECMIRLQKTLLIYIRASFSQETRASSGKTLREACCAMKAMCADERLVAILDEYPVEQLGSKQRIFVSLLKHRSAFLLYLLAKLGVF